MGVRQTFNDFHSATRVLLLASLALGLLFLAGLTLTDAGVDLKLWGWDPKPQWLKQFNADWLHSHSYIPNILAAITSFLIGAPIALIVLATFTVQREQRAALDRVNKMSALAWQKFRNSALELCTDERIYQGLKHYPRAVRDIHDEVLAEYQKRIAKAQTRDSEGNCLGTTASELLDFQDYLGQKADQMDHTLQTALQHVGSDHLLQIQWAIIRTNWNTLSQYVRLQRLEQNLPWFDDGADAQIADDLLQPLNPLTQFMKVNELHSASSTASIRSAIDIVRRDSTRPHEELETKLLAGYTAGGSAFVGWEYASEFGWKPVEGHADATLSAHTALWGLKWRIQQVEDSGWPENATKPALDN